MTSITNRSDINELLTQMRSLREQAQQPAANNNAANNAGGVQESRPGQAIPGSDATEGAGFTDMLRQAVDSVNDTQQQSTALQRAFEAGDPDVDITQVMIQMQKASVSFEAMNQVRNRLVSAYQDIMNMPI